MKIIDNNGKTIFEGKFNSTNLDFKDKGTDLSEPDKVIHYINGEIINSEVSMALYNIATSNWDWCNGVDDTKTELYINLLTDQFPDGYKIQAFCKPVFMDYDKMPNMTIKEKQMMEEIQNDMLQDVSNDGGGEWAIFNLQLDDTEKIELLEALACYTE